MDFVSFQLMIDLLCKNKPNIARRIHHLHKIYSADVWYPYDKATNMLLTKKSIENVIRRFAS